MQLVVKGRWIPKFTGRVDKASTYLNMKKKDKLDRLIAVDYEGVTDYEAGCATFKFVYNGKDVVAYLRTNGAISQVQIGDDRYNNFDIDVEAAPITDREEWLVRRALDFVVDQVRA